MHPCYVMLVLWPFLFNVSDDLLVLHTVIELQLNMQPSAVPQKPVHLGQYVVGTESNSVIVVE